jgi:hypothetical protein
LFADKVTEFLVSAILIFFRFTKLPGLDKIFSAGAAEKSSKLENNFCQEYKIVPMTPK